MNRKQATRTMLALLFVTCLAAPVASAEVMTYKGMGLNRTIRIQAPGVDLRTQAGQMLIEYQGSEYESYCVDIYHHAGTTDVVQLPVSTLNNGDKVAFLHETYGAVAGRTDAAALQVAIWEVVNEPMSSGFDVTAGSFTASGNHSVISAAAELLQSVPESYTPNYEYYVLHSDTKQDMLMATDVPVPEPGSMALLGLGACLSVFRRKRPACLRRSKEAARRPAP
jgi:hypothetical protein